MTELERLVRASLDAHAEEVDTTVAVAAQARAAARSRRGARIGVTAAVAAAAAVAIVAVAVESADPPGRSVPPVSSPTPTTTPAGWRAEYWKDISLDVPADWGWGTTPRSGEVLMFCGGPGAVRLPGEDLSNPDDSAPYVGRPVMLSDACMGGDVRLDPKAPFVWLDSPLPPGNADVGNGYTAETVQVGDVAVTVATDDAALRQQVLASAAVGGGACPASLDAPPRVVGSGGDEPAADSLLVCAYRGEVGGTYDLVYGDVLDAAAAAETEALVDPAPVLTGDCLNAQGGEWVTLTARGEGWSREYVVDLNCPAVTDSDGRMHRLTPEMVRPWAVDGLPVTLYGPLGGKGAWYGSFIGMLG